MAVPAAFWLSAAGSIASDMGNALTKESKGESYRNAYQNYINYLQGIANKMQQSLENRAEKYDTKLQDQFNQAEPQFEKEANTSLPEIEQMKQDAINEATDAQRLNRRQIEATMARQGVRGGQAAILENRALGEQNRDLQRDINQLAYNEAANRQQARLGYYSQKALTPWNTMSAAYGNSLTGANDALSKAQGNTYENAYATAMGNYLGTQNFGAKGWKKYVGGGLSMLGNAINSGMGSGMGQGLMSGLGGSK
jgi:hypothetical protein